MEKIHSLKGIQNLNFLRKLELGVDDNNYLRIESLVNLEYLVISESVKGLDFSNFPELKKIFFVYDKTQKGFEFLTQLEEISVSKANATYINEKLFSNYINLKKLEIVQTSLTGDLYFLHKCTQLACIEFHYCKGKIDFAELLPLKDSLEEIRISYCKEVIGYDSLKEFTSLKKLVLSDCNPVGNTSFIDYLPKLEQLTLVGKSYFEDGNINNLQRQGLTVGIDNKKHYTLKSNQFLNYFRNPPEPMR